MGKGDRRTKRGKLFRKSYGVKRPRKKKTKTDKKKQQTQKSTLSNRRELEVLVNRRRKCVHWFSACDAL